MTIHRNDSEGSFGSDNYSSNMNRNRGDGSPPMFELGGSIEDVSIFFFCILCRNLIGKLGKILRLCYSVLYQLPLMFPNGLNKKRKKSPTMTEHSSKSRGVTLAWHDLSIYVPTVKQSGLFSSHPPNRPFKRVLHSGE